MYDFFYGTRFMLSVNLKFTNDFPFPNECHAVAVIILGMGSANERRRYNVTSSLIGWTLNQNAMQLVSCRDVYYKPYISLIILIRTPVKWLLSGVPYNMGHQVSNTHLLSRQKTYRQTPLNVESETSIENFLILVLRRRDGDVTLLVINGTSILIRDL